MRKIPLTVLISLLALQSTFSQDKQVADTLKGKVENLKSDTLTIQLLNPKTETTGFDWQKNMPWVGAILIGLLTVLANILISRQSRNTNRESLNQQLKSSGEMTDKQLSSAKEIALSQIDNSRRIVQLDFNKTVLSGNRQAWINSLRDAISDYIAKSNTFRIKLDQLNSLGKDAGKDTDNSDLTEILRLETKIVLMLNSNEDDSKLLIERLGQYTTALFDDTVIMQPSSFFQQEIIDITKTILKKEWERVKKGE